jgi:hypothetical protein
MPDWKELQDGDVVGTTDMSPTGDLLVATIFLGRMFLQSVLEGPRVTLAWHKAGCSTPYGVTEFIVERPRHDHNQAA